MSAAPFLRLRQVCLVAADLAREAARIGAVFAGVNLEVAEPAPGFSACGVRFRLIRSESEVEAPSPPASS